MSRTAWLLTAAVALVACAGPAAARGADLDLPAGSLRDAVAALSAQARVSIAVASPELWRTRVPAIRGRLSVEAALARLLNGAAARATRVGPGAWRVAPVTRSVHPPPRRPPPKAIRVAPGRVHDLTADVVVTASKRAFRSVDFPGSASVIDPSRPSWVASEGTEALLAQAVTLTSTHLGSGRNKLFIRGIADSSFTGFTQATVGQYWGDVRMTYNAPDPDLRLHDVAAVEILEGPQGTLYGSGALGGIVRVVPQEPDLRSASGFAEAGMSVTWHGAPGLDTAASLNLPLAADRAGLRFVGYTDIEGGYIDDPLRGKRDINRTRVTGGRATVRVLPTDGWRVDAGLVAQDISGRDSQYSSRDGLPLTHESRVPQGFRSDYLLGRIVVENDAGPVRISSSTGFARQQLVENYDASLAGSPDRVFRQRLRATLSVNETRLFHSEDDGRGWLVGTSLVWAVSRIDGAAGTPASPAFETGVETRIDEQAVFAEGSVRVPLGISVTAGARASHSRVGGLGRSRDLPGVDRAAERDSYAFSPSLALSTHPLRRMIGFARYQEGYRPGGLGVAAGLLRSFRGDRLQTIEVGVRSGVRGRSPFDVSFSVSATGWRDIQADFVDRTGLPGTLNIGSGRIHSLSLSGGWVPARGLRLEAGMMLNDSRISDPDRLIIAEFPVSRTDRIPNIAGVQARAMAEYRTEFASRRTLALAASLRYVGRSRLGVGPILGAAQGGNLDTRASARLGLGRLGVTFNVTNLADSVGNRFALGSVFDMRLADEFTSTPPRTIRIGVDRSF